METVAAMVVGLVVGMTFFPPRWSKANANATMVATFALIFFMGVTLGGREGFLDDLGTLGFMSVAFCLVPTALSVLFVYALTSRSSSSRRRGKDDGEAASTGRSKSNPGETAMVLGAVASLAAGIAYGLSPFRLGPVDFLWERSSAILYALMLFVGISVGMSKGIFEKIRRRRFALLAVPAGTIAGTLAGGLLCSALFGMNAAEGAAVASGLGWYSLSGVLMTDLAGADMGSVTFLANLLREIVSFFCIPWISRHLNFATCIAPAAATSEDTTLAMLVRCTDEETVVLAVVNGIVCSAAVPVLIGALSGLF